MLWNNLFRIYLLLECLSMHPYSWMRVVRSWMWKSMSGRLKDSFVTWVTNSIDLSINGRWDKILHKIVTRIIIQTYKLKIINVVLIMTKSHYNMGKKWILPNLPQRGHMWVRLNECIWKLNLENKLSKSHLHSIFVEHQKIYAPWKRRECSSTCFISCVQKTINRVNINRIST